MTKLYSKAIEKCGQCPNIIRDDNEHEERWGKCWCEEVNEEVKEETIHLLCPLPHTGMTKENELPAGCDKAELKPCPFCGGEGCIEYEGSIWCFVYCLECDVRTDTFCDDNIDEGQAVGSIDKEEQAITAWNTRPTQGG